MMTKIRKLFNRLKQMFVREQKWNPIAWQGTKWVTIRTLSSGLLHPEIWFEIDRNKLGRVTLVPFYAWNQTTKQLQNEGRWTSLDKQLDQLLTEEQAAHIIKHA